TTTTVVTKKESQMTFSPSLCPTRHVIIGREERGPRDTHIAVEGCGIIQKLLPEGNIAQGLHTPHPHRPDVALLQESRGQRHRLHPCQSQLHEHQPVHHCRACTYTRAHTRTHTHTHTHTHTYIHTYIHTHATVHNTQCPLIVHCSQCPLM